MSISDPNIRLARDIALTLANSMERHGYTSESLAAWLSGRGASVSASVVKRWRNTASDRCIPARRLANLPPPILRDMLGWFAARQNAIIVDRVTALGGAKIDRELALDLFFASNALAQWLDSREGDIDGLCNNAVRSVERFRMGANQRPGLSRVEADDREVA